MTYFFLTLQNQFLAFSKFESYFSIIKKDEAKEEEEEKKVLKNTVGLDPVATTQSIKMSLSQYKI